MSADPYRTSSDLGEPVLDPKFSAFVTYNRRTTKELEKVLNIHIFPDIDNDIETPLFFPTGPCEYASRVDRDMTFTTIAFDEEWTDQVVLDTLFDKQLRPATFEEFISFLSVESNRKELSDITLVALGSTMVLQDEDGSAYYAVACYSYKPHIGHILETSTYDDDGEWSADNLFLAVPINS